MRAIILQYYCTVKKWATDNKLQQPRKKRKEIIFCRSDLKTLAPPLPVPGLDQVPDANLLGILYRLPRA